MGKLKKALTQFIIHAKELGIPEQHYLQAIEFVEYNEPALAFEIVIEQLYEDDIPVNESFYSQAVTIADMMSISETEYTYLQELIKE